MNLQVGHTLRPINHNNTQHFKGNQRTEQHHLLYKTIKYFNCYTVSMPKDSIRTHVVTFDIAKHFIIPTEIASKPAYLFVKYDRLAKSHWLNNAGSQ